MKTCSTSIYKTARKSAGLSQEIAAEVLHISTRTLSDYENTRTTPPDDIVVNMVKEYKAPWLAFKHLKETSMVANLFLPEIDVTDLAKAVLRFQKEYNDIKGVNEDMISIAYDDKITRQENERWKVVRKEIRDIIQAGFAIEIAR